MPSNVYNANWLASNLVRKYPLDSLASCIDDAGNYFPDELITDIQIAYPADLGEYCYVAAAQITDNIVSILIAVDTIPIAALCASIDDIYTRTGLYHNLTSLYDGAQGIIAIGSDKSSQKGSWTFSNPLNSRILPTCCTPYLRPNVLSISRPDDATPLEGNVLLTGDGDIRLDVNTIVIDGNPVKAIFVGLDLSVDPHNVLKKYITQCEVSTSMNSCAMPYLESIGGAIPDCSGNVIIQAGDSGHVNISTEDGVIHISTDLKLDDVCDRNKGKEDDTPSDSDSTQCPYPSVISDDICTTKSPGANISYDFTGTDVDLYSNDVQLDSNARAGILYGGNPDKPNSITSTDTTIPTLVNIKIKPESRTDLSLSFPDMLDSGDPKGSMHISIGNDTVYIDNGNVSVVCDGGLGEDRKYFGSDILKGCSECKVSYTDNQLTLITNFGQTVLASLDDGLAGNGDYKLKVQIGAGAYLDGVRYD